jgi:hypothetical protein
MSEYTSTHEGFQRAMQESLTGPPDEAVKYAERTALPTFYQIVNGTRHEYDDYVKNVAEWRGKISDYKPVLYVGLPRGSH